MTANSSRPSHSTATHAASGDQLRRNGSPAPLCADISDECSNAVPGAPLFGSTAIGGAGTVRIYIHAADCAPGKDPGQRMRALVHHGLPAWVNIFQRLSCQCATIATIAQ